MSQQSGSQSISTENRDLAATLRVYPPDPVFSQKITSLGPLTPAPANFPPCSNGSSSSSHVVFDVVLPATNQSGAHQYFGNSSSSPHEWTNSKSSTVMGSYDSPVPIGAAFPAVFACSSPPLVPVESLTPPISSPQKFFPTDASEYGSFPDSILTKALSNLELRTPMGISASLPATPASTARSDAAFPGLARLPSATETHSVDGLSSSTGLESSSSHVHVLSSQLSSDSCARHPAVATEPAGKPHRESVAEEEDETDSEEVWESVEALFDLARNNVHASSGSSVALVQARVIPAQHKGVITALVHTIDAISFPEEPKPKAPSKKGKHGILPASAFAYDAQSADSAGAAAQATRKRGSKVDKTERVIVSKAERQRAKKADRGGFKLPSAHALGIASGAAQGNYSAPTYHYTYSTAPTFFPPQHQHQLQHQQQQQLQPQQQYPQQLQHQHQPLQQFVSYQRQQSFPQQGYQQHGLALQSQQSQSQQYLPAYAQSSMQMHMTTHGLQTAPVSQQLQPLQPLVPAPAYGQSPTPSFALASQASSDTFSHVYAHSHAHTYPIQQQQRQHHQQPQPQQQHQQQQQQQPLFTHPLHYPYANSPSHVSLAGSSPTPSLSSSQTSSAHFHLGPQPAAHAQPLASQTPFLSAMEPRTHSQALRHSLSLGQPHNIPLPHARPLSAHQPLGTASARDHALHAQQPTQSHGVFPSALFAHQPACGTTPGDYHNSGLSTDTAARTHTPTHRRFTSWSEAAQ